MAAIARWARNFFTLWLGCKQGDVLHAGRANRATEVRQGKQSGAEGRHEPGCTADAKSEAVRAAPTVEAEWSPGTTRLWQEEKMRKCGGIDESRCM